jgi:glycosyltransferase involved in cell wall biosynthesis
VPQPSRVPIALFIWKFVPGGTENQMLELARRLDRARFDVHIACFHRSGPWLHRAEDSAAHIAEFPIRGFRRASTFRQMRAFARWCARHRIAVVHTTDLYTNIFGLPAAALARVPVRIGNRREINPDKTAGLIALQRAAYASAHRIVANSTAVAERLAAERLNRAFVDIVPNGIDLDRFEARAPRARLRRVVTVANLRPEKSHETLLEAASTVLRTYPDAEFIIVGDGVRRDELGARAERAGLAAHVRFLGHSDEVPRLLGESDLFVLPSRSEAMPNGVIEAMAAGMPVIATDVGGIPELVAHGRTGLLVPPGDAAALATALLQLMAAPDRAAALGRAARAEVERRFSFETMVSRFEHIYLAELAARAPRLATAQLLHS